MSSMVIVAGFVVAAASAARSTWSPCALSMLSSITPLAESGRGHRFRSTAGWFIAGAVAGGATLGALCAGGAALASDVAGAAGAGPQDLAGVAACACALAAAWDLGLLGLPMPVLRRQVNELWLDQFRAWVYGLSFGWQIGAGLTTYVMTAGVFATIVVAAATGSPWAALAIGTCFGTGRGLAVLLGRRVTCPDALRAVHGRLRRLRRPVQVTVAVVLAGVAVALGALFWPVASAGAALVLFVAGARFLQSAPGRTRCMPTAPPGRLAPAPRELPR